jgi:hypothetical protein
MGRRARERALTSLGIECMADDYLNVFAGLVGELQDHAVSSR